MPCLRHGSQCRSSSDIFNKAPLKRGQRARRAVHSRLVSAAKQAYVRFRPEADIITRCAESRAAFYRLH